MRILEDRLPWLSGSSLFCSCVLQLPGRLLGQQVAMAYRFCARFELCGTTGLLRQAVDLFRIQHTSFLQDFLLLRTQSR